MAYLVIIMLATFGASMILNSSFAGLAVMVALIIIDNEHLIKRL